ncbi:MAG TPA: ATP-binding protein [Candidatus Saccharimonadales bacterium]
MLNKLYRLLIEPHQKDEDLRNRELVLNVLLAGTLAVLAGALFVIFVNFIGGRHFLLLRMEILTGTWLLTLGMYWRARRGHYHLPAYFVIALYTLLAVGVAWRWGVTFPPAILLFALVIMVAGTVLGASFPLYASAGVIALAVLITSAENKGSIKPDIRWTQSPFDMVVVIGVCLIFVIIALISWLFNEQTERSLKRARRAEAALRRQRDLLEETVEHRTRELQTAQLEKVQQMYRFAELGQLSTALMHDLANHLTTLSLDIEGLEEQNRSRMLTRAKRSIRYIDDMVAGVRDQLHGKAQVRPFGIGSEIDEIVNLMQHRARTAGVRIVWEAPQDKRSLRVRGEPIRFRQLMANLVGNAIDAYLPENTERREVLITAENTAGQVVVTITDWGRGISKEDRDKLFEPLYSTKKTGMGMGLFIAKQIAEEYGGSLSLDSDAKHTAFVVKLARG